MISKYVGVVLNGDSELKKITTKIAPLTVGADVNGTTIAYYTAGIDPVYAGGTKRAISDVYTLNVDTYALTFTEAVTASINARRVLEDSIGVIEGLNITACRLETGHSDVLESGHFFYRYTYKITITY